MQISHTPRFKYLYDYRHSFAWYTDTRCRHFKNHNLPRTARRGCCHSHHRKNGRSYLVVREVMKAFENSTMTAKTNCVLQVVYDAITQHEYRYLCNPIKGGPYVSIIRIYFCNFSIHCFPGRQPAPGQESAGDVSHLPLLLHHFLAGDIAHYGVVIFY